MKKILAFILILIMVISFTGCNKTNKNEIGEVNSHFSGFYVELVVDSEYKVKSINPTSIYSFKKDLLSNDSGNVENMGFVAFGESSKTISSISFLTDNRSYILKPVVPALPSINTFVIKVTLLK